NSPLGDGGMQTTSHILMIRPVNFAFNAETATSNAFQVKNDEGNVQGKALHEFDGFVSLLRKNGVDVTVVEDTPEPNTPDSIFPNNWISFHGDGTILLYPMFAASRRAERKEHVLETIQGHFLVKNKVDLSYNESNKLFLEGTGSMVLDREKKLAFACLSPRTDKKVLDEFCEKMNYTAVIFHSVDENGQPIYHTNVMMCIADKYVVICLESIRDVKEKEQVIEAIQKTGKEIIEINYQQLNRFAGNMLQIENGKHEKLLVMSTQAFRSLSNEQVQKLSGYNRIIHAPLNTIEINGGGSARCMMAEVHLPVLS
ncbi:MAG TPA: arginine deiminase-related protein, partial [Chitinophagaceae bacterium]|nr:arginine deiminase-related protein [Chitinophagaceae bacterium]